MLKIGVLALQGDFAEHVAILKVLGAEAREIRRASELADLDGLVIPGGESTTIDRLTGRDKADTIFDTIRAKAASGMPVYGTCMGSIFLAKEIEGSSQGRLALMDIKVRRNAFGPQKFSFERDLVIPELNNKTVKAVFIRAPIILSYGQNVKPMARVDEGVVMARQGNLLVTAFHPEITDDTSIHQYFLGMVQNYKDAYGQNAVVQALAH